MIDLLTLSRFALALPGVPANTKTAGCFEIPSDTPGLKIRIVVSAGFYGWDHLSASTPERCPTWEEMSRIRDLFWGPDVCVMQLHVPQEDHVCNHPYCLHQWVPLNEAIPRPPAELVGVKGMTSEQVKRLTVRERHAIQDEMTRGLEDRLRTAGAIGR